MEESGRTNCKRMIEEQIIKKCVEDQLETRVRCIRRINEGINSDVFKMALENRAELIVKKAERAKPDQENKDLTQRQGFTNTLRQEQRIYQNYYSKTRRMD